MANEKYKINKRQFREFIRDVLRYKLFGVIKEEDEDGKEEKDDDVRDNTKEPDQKALPAPPPKQTQAGEPEGEKLTSDDEGKPEESEPEENEEPEVPNTAEIEPEEEDNKDELAVIGDRLNGQRIMAADVDLTSGGMKFVVTLQDSKLPAILEYGKDGNLFFTYKGVQHGPWRFHGDV